MPFQPSRWTRPVPGMRFPSACCTGRYAGMTWSQRCDLALSAPLPPVQMTFRDESVGSPQGMTNTAGDDARAVVTDDAEGTLPLAHRDAGTEVAVPGYLVPVRAVAH